MYLFFLSNCRASRALSACGHSEELFGLMIMFSVLITFLIVCNVFCCVWNRNEDKLQFCDKVSPPAGGV